MQYLYILVNIISIVIQIYVCSIVFVIISHYLFTVSIAWARSGFDWTFSRLQFHEALFAGEYTVYIYESRIVDFICYMMLDELMSADP